MRGSIFLFLCVLVYVKTQDIITIAGNSTTASGSYSGDEGLAISATLQAPAGVAIDSSGNIYIADTNNNRIRKVTVSNGIISTIVGTGYTSFSGDNGAATSATVFYPYGVSTDTADNIYIADYGHYNIRKVTSGIITTFAGSNTAGFAGDGGYATNAQLNLPHKVAFDSSGNVYIADYGNNRVRKVDIVSNIISTVAGSTTSHAFSGDGGPATSASFYYIYGIALDSSDNLYIADAGNNRIRMVTNLTGTVSTICGLSTYGWFGDGGLAINAILDFPMGVTIDTDDNIYISDSGNYAIRKITASDGVIQTIAGNGNSGFSGDNGPATAAKLYYPYSTTTDAINNVYIADTYNNRIRKIVIATYSPSLKPSRVPTIASSPTLFPSNTPTTPTHDPTTMINNNSNNNENEDSNNSVVGLVVGIVIGIIALCGIGAYIFFRHKKMKLQTIHATNSLRDFNNTDSIDYGNYNKDNKFDAVVTGNIMHLNNDIELSRSNKDPK